MMKPSRRWIFFASVLGIGLIALGLIGRRAWLAWHNHRVNQWVESYGGVVSWTFQDPGNSLPKTPEAMRRLFGGEAVLDDIEMVFLSGSPAISLEEISTLNKLPRLAIVSLRVSGISDAHVEALSRNRSIINLDLSDSGITDTGLLLISRRLHRLRVLDLANTAITGNGLREIEKLTRLESLNLEGTQVSEEEKREIGLKNDSTSLRR